MKIEVLADADAVARAGAAIIAQEARAAVGTRGRFIVALSGGHTPWLMLRALAGEEVPWEGVHVVQVDERVAPAGHPDRNLTHMRESLLEHVPLRPEQIHAMPVESPDLEAAARQYAQTLRDVAAGMGTRGWGLGAGDWGPGTREERPSRRDGIPEPSSPAPSPQPPAPSLPSPATRHPQPILDLVHLGLGPDGHTASLVPGDPVLDVADADVAATGVYQGWRRLTLTYPILNRCRRVLWLVTGSEKAKMLVRLRNGDPSIPAGRVCQDHAMVLANRPAAAELGR